MGNNSYEVKTFPPIRSATIGVLDAASRKHMIHAIFEVDVSKPRDLIHQYKARNGETLSFTSYLIHCLAGAINLNKHMHAYRDWRNRLILFDEVDVSTPVERIVGEEKQVIPTILRSANMKSLLELHHEIRQAQSSGPENTGVFPLMRLFILIPTFIRGLIFRIMDRFPTVMKNNGGTVMLTNVGLFGEGGGWGIPIATHTLNVTVGGIIYRPVATPRGLEDREYLCLTVSFDHDIIDGAPAARFLQRFKEIIEGGESLKQLAS
jgi:pyruvate/2-oxoglutarate dehydrogenase complex dihydrolipoamide acyltransferase (E2) component